MKKSRSEHWIGHHVVGETDDRFAGKRRHGKKIEVVQVGHARIHQLEPWMQLGHWNVEKHQLVVGEGGGQVV